MKVYQLWRSFFDGDSHPDPLQLSLHQSLSGATDAAAKHYAEHPTWIPCGYCDESPHDGSVRVNADLDNDCGKYSYLITEIEVQP